MQNYVPRFSFEISEEQRMRADKLIGTYGLRKAIFSKILDDVLDLIEQRGGIAIGILMTPRIKPRYLLPSMTEVEEESKPKRQRKSKSKGEKDGESK